MPIRKFKIADATLLLSSLCLVFAIGEIAVRRYCPPSRYQLRAEMQRDFNAASGASSQGEGRGGAGGWLFVNTPSGKRLRPNADGHIYGHYIGGGNVHLRTNSLGCRGPEIDWRRRPRILFLGDSITLAEYLNEPQTFIGRLQTMADERGLGWETVNAGVSSIGIGTEYQILKELSPRVRPDVVVLNFYLNDADTSPDIELIPLPSLLSRSHLAQQVFQAISNLRYLASENDPRTPHGKQWTTWKAELREKYPANDSFGRLIQENYRDWGSAWSVGAQELLKANLVAMQKLAEENQARLAVVLHPVRYQVEQDDPHDIPQRVFTAFLKEHGVATYDLLPVLRAAYRKNPKGQLFYDQCHHSPEGAAVVAQALFPFLQQNTTRLNR